MSDDLEAVQFHEWGVWHAVRPDKDMQTICGRNAGNAKRMWEQWSERPDRCQQCVSSLTKNQPTTNTETAETQ